MSRAVVEVVKVMHAFVIKKAGDKAMVRVCVVGSRVHGV